MRKILAYLWLLVSLILQNLPSIGKISQTQLKLKVSESDDSKEKKEQNWDVLSLFFPSKWNISKIQRFRKNVGCNTMNIQILTNQFVKSCYFSIFAQIIAFFLRSKTWWNWSIIYTSFPWSSSSPIKYS